MARTTVNLLVLSTLIGCWLSLSDAQQVGRLPEDPTRRPFRPREGTVRLVGGRTRAEGNVEIFHVGHWGSICDDEWDIREAHIVCRSLGFKGVVRAAHNSEYGRGRRLIWMDNLYCTGNEGRLEECQFDGWGIHDCTSGESAGVVCLAGDSTTKPPIKPNTALEVVGDAPKAKTKIRLLTDSDITIRLAGGRTELEGRVEVKIADHGWGLLCGDGWGMLESMVVCRQLGLGYAQSPVQSSFFGGEHTDMVLSGVKCTGHEKNIADCLHDRIGQIFCPGQNENVAGVMCVREIADLVPDEQEIERSAYLEDRQLVYLQCAMEENCLASTAYQINKNDYGWHYERRRLLRFTARIGNIGTADFRPFLPKHAWQWHMCHLHYHSMEVFAHFDVIDQSGKKVAEGHKASFCLEDNYCSPGVEKKYVCANYGDQGITVGCTDTYLHNIDCQWVDITDLSPGLYFFKVSINPEFKVAEMTFDNNAAMCQLYYNTVSARIFNCTLVRP